MELGRFLGSLHPTLVHFPIVLLLIGVGSDCLALLNRQDRFGWLGLRLTLIGTAAALLAFVCGILAEVFAARSGTPLEPMESHEWLATLTTWLFLALASFRLFMGSMPNRISLAAYLAFALVGCAMLGVTAKRGGEVVYEYGANVAAARSFYAMTDEDLATVAQHQQQRTLEYSNQMHHIFGWMALALSLSILFERLRLGPLARLRALMPFVFLGGGVYLFVYSDWDSWPLSRLRPITDSEVILHKFIAVLMFGIGAGMSPIRRSIRNPQSAIRNQNKLIAVIALIGGGLLFTHIHTNAPYVANAIGVYLNHAVMGTVALSLACAVLLEDGLARKRAVTIELPPDFASSMPGPARAVRLLLPMLMMTESVLLLKYNEDLPWFLGYGVIDATAPHGGLQAHTPGGRAELLFDANSGMLTLHFFRARSHQRVGIEADRLDGLIKTGNGQQKVQFIRQNSTDSSVFRAQAGWLRREPLFTIRVCVPADDGRLVEVEFDPWVTAPLLPPLVGAEKVYGCTMCPDTLSSKPGKCAMCAMSMVEVPRERAARKQAPLHDPRYVMDFKAEAPADFKHPFRLRFTLRDTRSGSVVREFRVVHERLLHLFIVSNDLQWFDHVHPDQQADGSFVIDQHLPAGRPAFALFADLAPKGERPQVFSMSLTRPEQSPQSFALLREDSGTAREFDGLLVSLRMTPRRPRAGHEAQLTFHLEHDGKPVDDLDLFLGAAGHCVIISDDTKGFIHTHALQLAAAAPTGPDISFHVYFQKRGPHKAWAQFNHRGRIITASFVFWVS